MESGPTYQYGWDGASVHIGETDELAKAVELVEHEAVQDHEPGLTELYIIVSYDGGESYEPLLTYDSVAERWHVDEQILTRGS